MEPDLRRKMGTKRNRSVFFHENGRRKDKKIALRTAKKT